VCHKGNLKENISSLFRKLTNSLLDVYSCMCEGDNSCSPQLLHDCVGKVSRFSSFENIGYNIKSFLLNFSSSANKL
jgi:hypothetical protein